MFITFEGPEGSGKTTILEIVTKQLVDDGFPILRTREPGGTPISEEIREVILNKKNTLLDSKAEALLYAASRRQHLVEKIWPALKEGKIVLCDRYLDSSLAYQGVGRGLGIQEVLDINMFATDGEFPDLTIYFDLDPKVGLERIRKNKGREINRLDLEKLNFHNRVRDGFLEIAKMFPNRIVVIDACCSIEEVTTKVLQIIRQKLGVQ